MRLPLRPSHASCFIVLLIEIELAAKSVAVWGGGRGSWQHMCLQIIFNILFALCYKLRHKTLYLHLIAFTPLSPHYPG